MYFILLAIIMIGATIWTDRRLFKQHKIEAIYYTAGLAFVGLIYVLILYLKLMQGIELHGTVRVIGNMISNCLVPMIYLCICHVSNIKKLSFTTVFLFGFIIFDIFTKVTIFTDFIPVAQITDDINIHIYSNGEHWDNMNIYEPVEIIQLMWVIERIIHYILVIKKRGYKIAKFAIRPMRIIACICGLIIFINFLPDIIWEYSMTCILVLALDTFTIVLFITIMGHDRAIQFITDSNNEIVYFDKRPSIKKIKEELERALNVDKIQKRENITIEEAARIIGTNSSSLAQMIKTEYNMSFTTFIAMRRIEDAKKMIIEKPQMMFSDIATECGFNSAVNFSKAFRKATGMTAREWAEKQGGGSSNRKY